MNYYQKPVRSGHPRSIFQISKDFSYFPRDAFISFRNLSKGQLNETEMNMDGGENDC